MSALFGYLAGFLGVSSFLFAKKKNLLLARVATDLLFAIHYFLIDAFSGAYLSLVYISAVILVLMREKLSQHNEVIIRLVICAIAGLIIYQTYEGVQDILILIATWVSFFMYGVNSNIKLRLIALLVVNPLWLVYAVISGSVPAMLTLLAYEIATIIGLYRAYKSENQETT